MAIRIFILLYTVQLTFAITPTLDLCDDGLIDTAVQTKNESIYLFKGSNYFRVNTNFTQIEHIGSIRDWKDLPDSPEIGFTITDDKNRLYGKTFFVKTLKNARYYFVYEDMQLIKKGSAHHWDYLPRELHYAVIGYNDSVLGIYNAQLTKLNLNIILTFATYLFDDYDVPSYVKSMIEKSPKRVFGRGMLRAAFQTPKKLWYIFFADGDEGWYCTIQGQLAEQCEKLYLWNTVLKCPPEMRDIPDGIFFKLWKFSGLNAEKLWSSVTAILVSCLLITLTVHIVISLTARGLYKKKRYKKHKWYYTEYENDGI